MSLVSCRARRGRMGSAALCAALLLAPAAVASAQTGAAAPAPAVDGRLANSLRGLADTLAAAVVGRTAGGLSIGVWQNGEPLVAGAWGWEDAEDGTPVSEETIFRLASVTKPMVSAAAFQLAETGAVDLDARLDAVLGIGFGDRPVRLRDLLSQTSGLTRSTDTVLVEMATQHGTDRAALLPRLGEHLAGLEGVVVGDGWRYANTNYVLAGWMLESLTGQPLEALIRSPLPHPPESIVPVEWCTELTDHPRVARGHTVADGAPVPLEGPLPAWYAVTGGAGLACATRSAVGAWANRLLERPDLLEGMAGPVTLRDGRDSEYGYGVIVDPFYGTRRFAHSGGMLGHSARVALLPELGVTVVVLATTPSEAVVRAVETRLLRRLLEEAG
jgi:D-alanyl-D-alanine carboxypeptidase